MTAIYLDHNSTTPMREEARAEMLRVLAELEGNPSSPHARGRRARHLLDRARERVAGALGVDEEEIIFTSGGTESNNLALLGSLRRLGRPGRIVTSRVEHSSVLEAARQAQREGHAVEWLEVDSQGAFDPAHLAERAPGCDLVTVMAANNEVGTCAALEHLATWIDPPADSGTARGAGRPLVHTDAVQALGRLPLSLREWEVDLASFSAHKFGGPVGVGILFRRQGVELEPLMYGGGQEGGLRPGTENVAAASAAALATELAVREQGEFAHRAQHLAQALWEGLDAGRLGVRLAGPPLEARRLPGTLSLLVPNVDGRMLVTRLDLEGLQVSAGSACASGSIEPSHVLSAMGYSSAEARAALRVSIGRTTTLADVRTAVETLRKTLG
jgi:cysteine desulfurase